MSTFLGTSTLVLCAVLLYTATTWQISCVAQAQQVPVVISTWRFLEAVRVAWKAVERGSSAVDAVVDGCSACEELQCDGSVGYGGSPDEKGETTLDAMVMDGTTMDVGAVAALRFVKQAAMAAKLVLQHTEHSLLVGDQASAFAISLGLQGPVDLRTEDSIGKWSAWINSSCQPNFWRNVLPNNKLSCGPYELDANAKAGEGSCGSGAGSEVESVLTTRRQVDYRNHDTISMAAIDSVGRIAVATSTNGATFKIPGRVGDGPIVGAGAYADGEVGACGATGDGDIMMRFLSCYQVVESMRQGMSPKAAAVGAIARIRAKFPFFVGAVFAVNTSGSHAGACNGWTFQYSVRSFGMEDTQVLTVYPDVPVSTDFGATEYSDSETTIFGTQGAFKLDATAKHLYPGL